MKKGLNPSRILNLELHCYLEQGEVNFTNLHKYYLSFNFRFAPRKAFQNVHSLFSAPGIQSNYLSNNKEQRKSVLRLHLEVKDSPFHPAHPPTLALKVFQLSPLPAALKSKAYELPEIQSLRTSHCGKAMTLEQMENFSGTKCAQKNGFWL